MVLSLLPSSAVGHNLLYASTGEILLMIAYTPNWKSTDYPPERKMLISATGDKMQYKANTDIGKKDYF